MTINRNGFSEQLASILACFSDGLGWYTTDGQRRPWDLHEFEGYGEFLEVANNFDLNGQLSRERQNLAVIVCPEAPVRGHYIPLDATYR